MSVGLAVAQASAASPVVEAATRADRARWLVAVADAVDSAAIELEALAETETHLGGKRLRGEIARTTGQLRMFAEVLTEGSYLEAAIDLADDEMSPPRPDLRRMLIPLGPVAVYAASNFPFAFSVLGGDTAAALAAGAPVVVKAHPAHPKLSRRVAEIGVEALSRAGAPAGTLGIVEGFESGIELIQHPSITAAAFTGSESGGRALFDLAAARDVPIPFFGELSSTNPVVITAGGLRERGDDLASGLVNSFTLGAGQFCTKPGLVFVPSGAEFGGRVADILTAHGPQTMLTPAMHEHHAAQVRAAADVDGVRVLSPADPTDRADSNGLPLLLSTDVDTLLAHRPELMTEHFGPSTLLVEYSTSDELRRALAELAGGLTATIHSADGEDVGELVAILRRVSGRLLFDGWPTGVAVSWAQHHGGPYPATTSSFTSVGATSIRRFLRPVAYQSAPAEVLPEELRDGPVSIPRRIDGVLHVPEGR